VAYIYSITNLINNKFYIGLTTQANPYDRWKQHLQLARNKNNLSESNSAHSMPIIRAIHKYGPDNFKFRIVEECDDNIVNKREIFWIEKLNAYGKNGYNITLGGEGVKKPHKYWGNHPHSKPVSCFTLEGEWIRDYDTSGVAADCLGDKKQRNCISACIKGVNFQALGYRWAYKGEEPKLVEKRINRRGVVYGVNLKTGRKKMWQSQADAAQDITGNRKNNNGIQQSLNSPNKNKLQAYDWYLFRTKKDALGKWTPATKDRGTEYYSMIGSKSAEKRKRPIYGINIKTGERIDFNSMIEASYFIKGEDDKTATSNIAINIKKIENGQTWCYSFGYRWYYKEIENSGDCIKKRV
jgi:hypothetical protein